METLKKNNGKRKKAEPMLIEPFSIRRVKRETIDTFSLELESGRSKSGMVFAPGQFNMLYVYGIGEIPISISGDPTDRTVLVHTIRTVGTVTGALGKLRVGDTVGIRGPFGTGWPIKQAIQNDVVIVAGGIGLAPLRPVINHIQAHREKFGKFALLYGARTPEDILYWKDLQKWRSRFDMEIDITVDRATGKWRGNVGVVTTLIRRASFDPDHCIIMICGPEIMMRFTILELENCRVGDESIYISMERNMKCGIGLCGHCQLGPSFVCKDGPVYNYGQMKNIFSRREM